MLLFIGRPQKWGRFNIFIYFFQTTTLHFKVVVTSYGKSVIRIIIYIIINVYIFFMITNIIKQHNNNKKIIIISSILFFNYKLYYIL